MGICNYSISFSSINCVTCSRSRFVNFVSERSQWTGQKRCNQREKREFFAEMYKKRYYKDYCPGLRKYTKWMYQRDIITKTIALVWGNIPSECTRERLLQILLPWFEEICQVNVRCFITSSAAVMLSLTRSGHCFDNNEIWSLTDIWTKTVLINYLVNPCLSY